MGQVILLKFESKPLKTGSLGLHAATPMLKGPWQGKCLFDFIKFNVLLSDSVPPFHFIV